MTEDLRYLTASETEQILKKYFYGTWVEYTTQKKLTISKYERGGKGTEYTQRPQMAALQPYITIIWIIRRKYI